MVFKYVRFQFENRIINLALECNNDYKPGVKRRKRKQKGWKVKVKWNGLKGNGEEVMTGFRLGFQIISDQ